MMYLMPILPFALSALAPTISEQTMELHYGKHLQTYVNNLNNLVLETPYEGKTIEEIVATAPEGAILNNAGQVLNHTLYFLQFTPKPTSAKPSGKLSEAINKSFGSFDEMKKQMIDASVSLFGSGWVWLSSDDKGNLFISKDANAGNPIRSGKKPLLGIDVWEHAYYVDYQNRRAEHVAKIWDIINWEVVEDRFN